MRVAALTLGRATPSARFRVRQFIPALGEAGVHVEEHFPAERARQKLAARRSVRAAQLAADLVRAGMSRLPHVLATHRADATWLSKQVVVGIPSWETVLRKPLVLDVDDAMWLARPLGETAAVRAARAASAVTAGNTYLADWYRQHNSNVYLVPTSIDTDRFRPSAAVSERFIIGWTGSRATLHYLESLEPALDAFFLRQPDARLRVICDAAPRFAGRTREHVQFVPWSPASEVSALEGLSVGIMPLSDDAISRGKCSFKMLQYMACGLPVVVSPVGSNADILDAGKVGFAAASTADWLAALEACSVERERGVELGRAGRELVDKEYSVRSSATKLSRVFASILR